jgi:hypothetical protein
MQLYPWVVFLHVASVLVFTLGHGVSAAVALRVRRESEVPRIAALLELSSWSLNVAGLGLLGVIVTGIAAGIMGGWFGSVWLWASIVIFVLVGGLMTPLGRGYLDAVRVATGSPVRERKGAPPPPAPLGGAELAAVLDDRRPLLTALLGMAGLLVLTWLMMFKPF